MPSPINSSTVHAADPHHGADGASHVAPAGAPRTGVFGLVRRVLGAYVGFNQKLLSAGMRAFSSPPSGSEPSFDRHAYMDSVMQLARHRLSGNSVKFEATLRAMDEKLKGMDPERVEDEHQRQARQQAEHHHARHMQRTHAQTGEDNALSLLGGHGAADGHGHTGHTGHTGHSGHTDAYVAAENAELRKQIKAMRELLDDSYAPRPRTGQERG